MIRDVDHNINISKYKPLSGSSYINKNLDHPKKDVINNQKMINVLNIFDRYFDPANYYPRGIRKNEKNLAKKTDFEDIFPSKLEIFTKLEKENCLGISDFGYENK